MKYIKGGNSDGRNFLNSNKNPYDIRSNNLLLTNQRGLTSNKLPMENSNLNGAINNKINVGKKNNTLMDNKNIQIVNQSNLNKNKSQKDDLIKVVKKMILNQKKIEKIKKELKKVLINIILE